MSWNFLGNESGRTGRLQRKQQLEKPRETKDSSKNKCKWSGVEKEEAQK